MRYRLTFVVVLLILAAPSLSRAGHARTYRDLTVHEWGTFTSIAGENGTAIEWTPQAGPQDLPCFVDRFRFNIKGWLPGRIRMETPVLYFYAPRNMMVNVSVRFRQGMVTEWYPDAAVAPLSVSSTDLRSAAFESSITWRDVMVAPRAAPDFPDDARASHYYTARNTDASPLQLERFPLRRRNTVAAMPDVVGAFVGREEVERNRDEAADLLIATWPRCAHEAFQFREREFDRIEIRTVGREEPNGRAHLLDRRPDLGLLMGREIVEYDDIARSQGGHQHLFDVGEETRTINGSVEDGGCAKALATKRGDHGVGLPMTARRVIRESGAARAPTVAP
jgi:hypothetical protein